MKEYEVITQSMNANETEVERATISMPAELLEEGKAKARAQRRSFSAYLATLIERDIASEAAVEPQTAEAGS